MNVDVLKGVVGFDWNEANIEHIAEHDVTSDEAEKIFSDEKNVLDEDIEHLIIENRFLIIGKTEKSRLLYQIFTRRGDKIRVISSRDINKKEVQLYEKRLVVPKFENEKEESRFWANLDLAEYFEPSDFKRGMVFPSLKRTKRLISIRLPEQLLVKVKNKAHKLDTPYQNLIQQYIQQGVEK